VEKNLVHRELNGRVSAAEVIESIDSVVNHPDFRPGMQSLNDLREVENTADADYVMRVAQAMVSHTDRLASAKIAVVVSTELIYGMLRMLQSYISETPLEVMLFKDLDEAVDWLDL
jgi:hypothetical protein